MSTYKQTFVLNMQNNRPTYLDCNATTPLDPHVREVMLRYLDVEFGNAGSRTHAYGAEAAKAVRDARIKVASVVDRPPEDVIFTSGATESNNLGLLGLAQYAEQTQRKHIVTTQVEHKAILEPISYLRSKGYEVTLVPPNSEGLVDPYDVMKAIRPNTLLVSVMHVNNETGVRQPLAEIADMIPVGPIFHTDGAQGFAKELVELSHKRIDMISTSSHKIFGPKGVGALIANRATRNKLVPLQYGGSQERGLRAGTLPTFLIAGFGTASSRLAERNSSWLASCQRLKDCFLSSLQSNLPIRINGDLQRSLPNTLNFSVPGVDNEAIVLALKSKVAISTGSACTADLVEPSHVLRAMSLPAESISSATRWSWSDTTADTFIQPVVATLKQLMS